MNGDRNFGDLSSGRRRRGDFAEPELEPIEPREAMDIWLEKQGSAKAEETIQSYRYRLEPFVEWCEQNGIDNMNDLAGRDVLRFDSQRRDQGDLTRQTLNNQLGTLKQWLQWCVTIEAAGPDLPLKVDVPELSKSDRVRREKLPRRRAEEILDYLDTFEYASVRHAMFLLMWHTGARLGGLHSLDVEDCFLEEDDLDRLLHVDDLSEDALEDVEPPFLFIRHRPGEGTTLKNDYDGERPVAISDDVAEVLRDYIEVARTETTDEYDRRPLFTSRFGRLSKSSMRRYVYQLTQPCHYDSCPHGRDADECDALDHGHETDCPSVKHPHAVRSGSIVYHRDKRWHPADVSERVNASVPVIEDHYDDPEQLRRMAARQTNLDRLNSDL